MLTFMNVNAFIHWSEVIADGIWWRQTVGRFNVISCIVTLHHMFLDDFFPTGREIEVLPEVLLEVLPEVLGSKIFFEIL